MSDPMIILILGLPGTGKTTFAGALSSKLQADHFNSDKVRIALGKQGQYDEASKDQIYRALLNHAIESIKRKRTVIIDAMLYKNTLREPYLKLAEDRGIPIIWIELKANERVVRDRVRRKRTFSEADFSVYQKIKKIFEPLTWNHLTLFSDQLSISEMVRKTMKYLELKVEK